jgi:predicted transposase YbfD/YdcC
MNTDYTLITILRQVDDPRIKRSRLHNLIDILAIAICSSMCGMTGWEEFEAFGEDKEEWFKTFLELPNGIPSHDTFRRVFERIDPRQLQNALTEWSAQLHNCLEGKVVAIDGKTLRSSFDNTKGLAALHSVSAFVTESKFVLGQTFVEKKENEITAIPELLKTLEIKGAIVTIDAMGCQKKIAKQIVNEKKADYVLALKRNHPDLYNETSTLFRLAEKQPQIQTDSFCSHDKGHGRIETRTCTCIEASPWLEHVAQGWTKLQTVVKLTSTVERNGKLSEDTRYFLSSLPCDAKEHLRVVREHWRIENTLHWSLDVVFKEDQIHIRKDNSPKNLSIIRRIAFSLAKERTPEKMTTKRAQLRSVLNPEFAERHFFKN